MDLTEALDIIRSDDSRLSSMLSINEGVEGAPINRLRKLRNNPQYKMKLAECAKFIAEVVGGQRPAYHLREVMTTSDFPFLFADVLDRSVLASYEEWPNIWTDIAKRVILNDFRDAKVYPPVYGADGILPIVPESDQYPIVQLSEQEPFLWHVTKYGRKVPFSWEAIINDDLNQLTDIPEKLGRGARRTETDLIARLYVGTTGLNTSMYHNNFGNIVNTTNGARTDNPPLSIEGLEDAYIVMSNMRDESGQPILRSAMTLVVSPALEVTAQNILNAITIATTRRGGIGDNGSGGGHQELQVRNWMAGRLTLRIDPYIPMIATTNGNTSWYLFANPNSSREAMRIGFLRGHESPEIWMKSPNAIRVGGGAVDPMSGDFDTDSIVYRIRHVTGVTLVDPKATVASNGTGA